MAEKTAEGMAVEAMAATVKRFTFRFTAKRVSKSSFLHLEVSLRCFL